MTSPSSPSEPTGSYSLHEVMPEASPERRWSTSVVAVVAGVAAVAGMVVGAVAAIGGQNEAPRTTSAAATAAPTPAPTSARPSASAAASPTPAAPTTSYSPSPVPPPPPPTIEEGIWTVGQDIVPGKYRVATPLSGECYWSITKTGTNGDDIIANDIPTGGRPQVTLRKGQDFETNGCGSWVKVG